MIVRCFVFDLSYHLRSRLVYIVALTLALFGSVAVASALRMVADEAVSRAVFDTLGQLSVLSILTSLFFVALPLLRDSTFGIEDLFRSTPAPLWKVHIGRFLAGLSVSCAIFLLVTLVVAAMVWAKVGALSNLASYLVCFLALTVPNAFLSASMMLLLCSWFGGLAAAIVGLVAYLMLIFVAIHLYGSGVGDALSIFLDPSGFQGVLVMLRTSADTQSGMVFAMPWLANRIFWTLVAVVCCFSAVSHLRRSGSTCRPNSTLPRTRQEDDPSSFVSFNGRGTIQARARAQGMAGAIHQLLRLAGFELRSIALSWPFWLFLIIGLANLVLQLNYSDVALRSSTYLTSTVVLERISSSFSIILLLVVPFYAGELVWRPRELRVSPLIDSFPTHNWVLYAAKIIALLSLVVIFFATAGIVGIWNQWTAGHREIDGELFVLGLF